jgi:hypothetical protein
MAITRMPAAAKSARRIPQTFECNPTSPELPATVLPDELMIDWVGVPEGATATIFLPSAEADQIAATASKLYGGQRITRTDAHTVSVDASGISYIPLPAGSNGRNTGLLTLELPPGMRQGHRCTVTVRQVTSVSRRPANNDARAASAQSRYARRVTGVFQLTVVIQAADALLVTEERSLAFFRWILATLAPSNRWYPVMQRYVAEIARRVNGLGGDASQIEPSPSGAVPHSSPSTAHTRWEGKIADLIYDRFGDFEGFILETEAGDHASFHSRERHVADLARWTWQERIRVTVFARESEPYVPDRILLHKPTSRGE